MVELVDRPGTVAAQGGGKDGCEEDVECQQRQVCCQQRRGGCRHIHSSDCAEQRHFAILPPPLSPAWLRMPPARGSDTGRYRMSDAAAPALHWVQKLCTIGIGIAVRGPRRARLG